MRCKIKKRIVLRVEILSLLFLFNTANATIWCVHPDSPLNSIKAGLYSYSTNDTILVAPGTCYENINFNGKFTKVTSEQEAGTTIISRAVPANPDSGSVGAFVSGENANNAILVQIYGYLEGVKPSIYCFSANLNMIRAPYLRIHLTRMKRRRER